MKNIAIVKWTLEISGGGDRQALELAYQLQKKGYNVDVFALNIDKKNCYPDLIKKLSTYSVPKQKQTEILELSKYSLPLKLFYFIPNIFRKRKNLLALKDVIKQQDKKKQYDVINYHEGEVPTIAQYFKEKKNVWMLNDLFIEGNNAIETIALKFDNVVTALYFNRFIDTIVVLDNQNKKIIKKHLYSYATVIRSGLDQNKFYKKRLYKAKKQLSILATGIFFPHRRYEDLIEGMHIAIHKMNIKDIKLNIIGQAKTNQEYFNKIVSLIQKYNLKNNIRLLGGVSEKELISQYQKADIFVFPNSPQTWGLAVFEAMIAGCVAIVSKGAGAHEVLTNNKDALLVDPKSPEQIAKAIKKIAKDTKFRKKIATNGQDFVKESISWERYASQMIEIFKNKTN